MAIPKRVKVIDQGPTLFGNMAEYLTVGKEYDVDPNGFLDGDQYIHNTDKRVTIIADNGIPTIIRIDGRCFHGFTYEVVI